MIPYLHNANMGYNRVVWWIKLEGKEPEIIEEKIYFLLKILTL